jgi:aspartyl-tRNA synthetase
VTAPVLSSTPFPSHAAASESVSFDPAQRRSHWCGQLTPDQVGQTVTLNGWVAVNRDLGGLVFVEVRDRTGLVQMVSDPQKNPQVHELMQSLRSEDVVSFTGPVSLRPADTVNASLTTGTLEVYPHSLVVLNRSKTPPFPMDTQPHEVDEALRLRYRYLDLRRPEMFRRMELRHRLAQRTRNYLNENGFLEVETPVLIRTTPEGARDYLVPSRVHPGKTFALPQSPQLFKQLLMMGGMERYYQIARCFRDEDLRADRQPEFTQIDMELSFVTQEDVMTMMEGLIVNVFDEANVAVKAPFRRMTWRHAMETYGSDKPDLRFGLELVNLTPVFLNTGFAVFKEAAEKGIVLAIRVPGAAKYSRKELDDLQSSARKFGAKGLAYILYTPEGPKSPILKYFTPDEIEAVTAKLGAGPGDGVFFMADTSFVKACDVLGRFRLHFAKRHELIDTQAHELTWVVDFPMFDVDEETGALSPCHHPFTAPHPEDIGKLDTDPASVRSLGYDLAYNGSEIGGGSIRIHHPDLQAKLFSILGFSEERIDSQFGFLVEALRFGAPPHGGLAFGLDRIVALLAGVESIREVIAFPKNNQAICLMTQAPVEPGDEQLKELHFKWQLPVVEPKGPAASQG